MGHLRLRRFQASDTSYDIFDSVAYYNMWITRDVEPKLQRSARTRPVMVLTGARQTGKTSTLLRLFPNHAFMSLDLATEAEQAEKEPGNLLRRHPAPAIIDEVEYAPGLRSK